MNQKELDPLVSEIVKSNTKPIVAITIREIAEQIEKQTGIYPSTSEVKYSLNRLGIQTDGKRRRWIYRHNPPKGE